MIRQRLTVMNIQEEPEHTCTSGREVVIGQPLKWLDANGQMVMRRKHVCTVCGKMNLK